MMFTALIMRPWVMLAKGRGCIPRILADDIMLIAKGKGAIRKFATTLQLSHQYLLDMGAKIAHGKSVNFASTKPARTWLAETAWVLAGGAIKVVEHLRYLGGHITMGAKRHHSTISGRGQHGQAMARRVDKLPVARNKKAAIIRAKVIPASLYGVEIADPTEKEYASLTSAILSALTGHASRKDVDWAFHSASFGDDLDPVCLTLTRRCLALRRTIAKRPHPLQKYQASIVPTRPNTRQPLYQRAIPAPTFTH